VSEDNTKVPEAASGNRVSRFMRRHPVLTGLAALIAITYLYIQWAYPTYRLRYRLTVEVETPNGLKTGSSVIESKREEHIVVIPGVLPESWRVTGEAVFVDLGDGKNLIVTLTNRSSGLKDSVSAAGLPYSPGPDLKVSGYPARWRAVKRLKTRNIAPERLPTIVTFTDINDPKTVKRVDPRNLAASFGEDYALKRATVEVTHDVVSEGIEGKLSWLRALKGGYLHGGFSSRGAPYGLYGGQFKSKGLSP